MFEKTHTLLVLPIMYNIILAILKKKDPKMKTNFRGLSPNLGVMLTQGTCRSGTDCYYLFK